MNSKVTRTKKLNYLLLFIGISPFIYWVYTQLPVGGWWDEMISLENYAIRPIKETVTNYADPNNHIFLNLFDNIVSRIIGVTDFYEILDYIWLLRIIQAVFNLITFIYIYKIFEKFISKEYAILPVILLIGTIPFLNYSLQLRGYNMCNTYIVMCIFHSWNYIDHLSSKINRKRILDLIIIFFSILFMCYTIPSYAYFVAAFAVTILINWGRIRKTIKIENPAEKNKRKKVKSEILIKASLKDVDKKHLLLAAVVLLSIVAIYLAYYPVLDKVLHNRWVDLTPTPRLKILRKTFPVTLKYFVSQRWLLIILALAGLWYSYKRRKEKTDLQRRIWDLIIILFLPALIITIQNKDAMQRTFFNVVVCFVLLISACIVMLFKQNKMTEKKQYILLSIIVVYNVITAFCVIKYNENKLQKNLTVFEYREHLEINRLAQNNPTFKPQEVAKFISKNVDVKSPVLLINEIDRVSLMWYLEKYNIKSTAVVWTKKENIQVKGNKYNHLALIQSTVEKYKRLTYMDIPYNIPDDYEFKNYYLLLSINLNQYPQNKEFIMVTAYPNKQKRAEKYFKDLKFKKLYDSPHFQVFSITRK